MGASYEAPSLFDKVKGEGKVLLNLGLDTLSAPARAFWGSYDDIQKGNIDFGDGLLNPIQNATDEKNDPSDVLHLDGAAGLGADILLDPTTWLTGGVAGVAKGGAKAGLVSWAKGGAKAAVKKSSGIDETLESTAKPIDLLADLTKKAEDEDGLITKYKRKIQKSKKEVLDTVPKSKDEVRSNFNIWNRHLDDAERFKKEAAKYNPNRPEADPGLYSKHIEEANKATKKAKEIETQLRTTLDSSKSLDDSLSDVNVWNRYLEDEIRFKELASKRAPGAEQASEKFYKEHLARAAEAGKKAKEMEKNLKSRFGASFSSDSKFQAMSEWNHYKNKAARLKELATKSDPINNLADEKKYNDFLRKSLESEEAAKAMEKQIELGLDGAKQIDQGADFANKTLKYRSKLEAAEKRKELLDNQIAAAKTPEGRAALEQSAKVQKPMADKGVRKAAEEGLDKQAYIGARIPFGPGIAMKAPPVAAGAMKTIPYVGAIAKAGSVINDKALGPIFQNNYKVKKESELLADLNLSGSGLAQADAAQISKKIIDKYIPKIVGEDHNKLQKFLNNPEYQGMSRDLLNKSENVPKHLQGDKAKKVVEEFNSLSPDAQKFVKETQSYLEQAHKEAMALGIMKEPRTGIYFPQTLSKAAQESRAEGNIASNSFNPNLHADPSMSFARTAKQAAKDSEEGFDDMAIGKDGVAKVSDDVAKGTDDAAKGADELAPEDEMMNPFEALDGYITELEQAKQGKNIAHVLRSEVGQKFKTVKDAEEAGFVKPSNQEVAKTLGKDEYLPEAVDRGLKNLTKLSSSPKEMKAIGKAIEKFTAFYRTAAYTVAPGRMTIDTIGDIWNMHLNGINWTSHKMPKAMKDGLKIDRFITGKLDDAGKPLVKADDIIELGGNKFTVEELALIAKMNNMYGAGKTAANLGAGFTNAGLKARGKKNPLRYTQAGSRKMEQAGTFRDNRSRLTGMMLAIDQKGASGASKMVALNDGVKQLKEAVFDYSDLSAVEKNWFRNIAPFYSWSRFNLPYQIKKLAEAPIAVSSLNKVQEYSYEKSGLEEGAIPEYLRNSGFGLPIKMSGMPLAINPMTPTADTGQFQNFQTGAEHGPLEKAGIDGQSMLSMLNPIPRGIIELTTGKTLYTGQDVNSLTSYIPQTYGGQLGGIFTKMNTKDVSNLEKGVAVSNFLTGLRIKPIDLEKSKTSAEFLQMDIDEQARKKKERDDMNLNFMQSLFGRD